VFVLDLPELLVRDANLLKHCFVVLVRNDDLIVLLRLLETDQQLAELLWRHRMDHWLNLASRFQY